LVGAVAAVGVLHTIVPDHCAAELSTGTLDAP
jgi:hypothetical protein